MCSGLSARSVCQSSAGEHDPVTPHRTKTAVVKWRAHVIRSVGRLGRRHVQSSPQAVQVVTGRTQNGPFAAEMPPPPEQEQG